MYQNLSLNFLFQGYKLKEEFVKESNYICSATTADQFLRLQTCAILQKLVIIPERGDLTVPMARWSAMKKLADKVFLSSSVAEDKAQANTEKNYVVKFNVRVKGKE